MCMVRWKVGGGRGRGGEGRGREDQEVRWEGGSIRFEWRKEIRRTLAFPLHPHPSAF